MSRAHGPYTVTLLDADDCVIAQAFEMYNHLGPAKSCARQYMRDPEYLSVGIQKVEVTSADGTVEFDLFPAVQS